MIKVTAQADLRELERAMGKLKEAFRRRTFPEIVNRSAGSIALKAMMKTSTALAEKIRDYFTRVTDVRYSVGKRGKNAGKIKMRIIREVTDVAVLSYLKRNPDLRKQRGGKMPMKEFEKKVKAFVNASVRSAGYLRHGWKEVIDIYRQWMKGDKRGPSDHRHKSAKTKLGTGTPASMADNSLRAEASLFNRAVIKHEKSRLILEKALREAVVEETRQLKSAAEHAIAKDVKAVGG